MTYRVQRLVNPATDKWVNGAAFNSELEARINVTERARRSAEKVPNVFRIVTEETVYVEVFRTEGRGK